MLLFSRLHGSYEALKYGTSLDGLSDLTGGIAENIILKPNSTDISNQLAHLLKLTSIILCKVEAKNADEVSLIFRSEFFKNFAKIRLPSKLATKKIFHSYEVRFNHASFSDQNFQETT